MTLNKPTSQVAKIQKLKQNPDNPRFIKDDKFALLVKSVQEFPEMLVTRPIVVNTDYVILGGNMRYRACKEAGLKEVPIVIVDWDEEKQKEFVIKDNSGFGQWDMEILANLYDADLLLDWGVDIDFSSDDDLESSEDDFEVELPSESYVKRGDLIDIGGHRLLCGDATVYEDYVKLTSLELCDAILTDPPYNVNYEGGTEEKLKIDNDSMEDNDFYIFLTDAFSRAVECVKPGSAFYCWHAESEGINFRLAAKAANIQIRQCLIWVKNQLVMGRQDYQWKHEPCLYGWKEGAAHRWFTDRKQTTVLEFDKPRSSREHPTMKPVELMAYLIKNSTKAGEIVLDPFVGSGTTMVASHQLSRKCYAMELDPKYCQVVIDRMLKLDPSLQVKINGQPHIPNT